MPSRDYILLIEESFNTLVKTKQYATILLNAPLLYPTHTRCVYIYYLSNKHIY